MNNLEERIVKELQAERDLVPTGIPGPLPAVPARWARYLSVAAVALTVVGIAWIGSRMGTSPSTPSAAASENGEILIDGTVSLPIRAELEPITVRGERLEVFAGAPAPSLAVDVDLGGDEQPLVAGVPRWDQSTWAGDVPLVYVGDRSGRSVFVHTNGTIGFLDRILSGGDIGDHICMTVGDSSSAVGGSGFCSSAAGSHAGQFHDNTAGVSVDTWWVTWIDVPAATAIVTLEVETEPFAWQAPVGEAAFFDLPDRPTDEVTMTAIGVDGESLGSETLPIDIFR